MSGDSGAECPDENGYVGAADTDENEQQAEKAARLARHAGESVDRRYDATKEIHHDEGERT